MSDEEKTSDQPEEEEEEEEHPLREQQGYYKEKYKHLEDLPDVGPATITKLKEAGYHTVEDLAMISDQEIKSIDGLGDSFAKIVQEAKKTIETSFITANELMKIREKVSYLSTGCSTLDDLLKPPLLDRGGIPSQSISEFFGEFGSGKSQLCHQLCCTVLLPKEQGGLEGRALYIDSEHVLLPERMVQIGARLGLDRKTVLDGVITAEAFSSNHQIALVEACGPIIKEHNVQLLIIDSLTSHFRSEYLGRETLAKRQQLLNRHLHRLLKIARGYNIPVVITNQVSATPDSFASRTPKPIGGNIVGHAVHTRMFIRKGRDELRIMKVIASPFLPQGEAPCMLNEYGFISSDQLAKIEAAQAD